jgi:O-acetyl-ADP-ribose deacetylase (regulator of RNase III)
MSTEIKYIKGNIFTSKCQTLVNTVNCVGIMGAGIALEFKYRYAEMFEKYVKHCKEHLIQIGKLSIYEVPNKDQKVLNFPTKNNWKNPSKYEYLTKGLEKFLSIYKEKNITSVAFPLLGALNGGLDPDKVKSLMFDYLERCEIPVEIYEYTPTAQDDLIDIFTKGILYSQKEFQNTTGLSNNVISKLRDVIAHNDLCSLIQLAKVPGIGEETVKACFHFAMKFKQSLVLEPEIFDDASIVNSTQDNKAQPNISKSTADESNEPPSQNNGDVQAPSSPKKSISKNKKTKQPKIYTQTEKLLFTNLPADTIEKIEKYDPDITFKDIMTYCSGLKINFKKFILDHYVGKATPKKKITS